MSSAELAVVVGVIAGSAAIATYLRDRYRTGTLVRNDAWTVALMAAGLVAFGMLLLAGQSVWRVLTLAILFVGAALFLVWKSRTPTARLAGLGLLAAIVIGLIAWLLREIA